MKTRDRLAFVTVLLLPSLAAAQTMPDGYVSATVDYFPRVGDAVELRTRIFAEQKIEIGRRLVVNVAGFVEGLVADRSRGVRDAIIRPQDVYVDLVHERFDIRAGVTRVVWGRLDELQPSDVVNPLDVSRFLFEGRSEARLPVWLVRGRLFLTDAATLEGIVVPAFTRGRFDQLDEPSSPFTLAPDIVVCLAIDICPPLVFERQEPPVKLENAQGGARFSATTGRVDWSVAAYRGFEPFGIVTLSPAFERRVPPPSAVTASAVPVAARAPGFIERFPRFTMIAADYETVTGPWAFRGELAAFVEDHFQAPAGVGMRRGRSFEGGVGLDRRAGDYGLSASVLVRREDAPPDVEATKVTLVAAAERSFARQTRIVRAFAAYNASDGHAFVRNITAVSLRDNVWLEGSVGWFFGAGADIIGRFGDRDFVYGRLKVYF